MFRIQNILIAVLVLALVAVGVWAGMKFAKEDPDGASKYSVVSTVNGDIYFGEIKWFPRTMIKDAWALQRIPPQMEGEQGQLSIVPVTEAFWQPVGDLYLNSKNIVSWTYLRNDSQVAKALADPDSVRQQGGQQVPPGSDQPPVGTSTFRGPSENPPSTP